MSAALSRGERGKDEHCLRGNSSLSLAPETPLLARFLSRSIQVSPSLPTSALPRHLQGGVVRGVVGRRAVDDDAAAVDREGERLAAGQGQAVQQAAGAGLGEERRAKGLVDALEDDAGLVANGDGQRSALIERAEADVETELLKIGGGEEDAGIAGYERVVRGDGLFAQAARPVRAGVVEDANGADRQGWVEVRQDVRRAEARLGHG